MFTSGNWGEKRKRGRLKMKRNEFAGAAAPDARIWIHNFQPHIHPFSGEIEEKC